MARARATCTCAQCGATFVRETFKRNRTEADNWVEWAQETFNECPQCYGKRMREEERQKPFTIEVKLDPYEQMFYFVASGNTFPHKDELKAHGYRWDEEPCSGFFGPLSMARPKKVWQKAFEFDEAAVARMREEEEAAKAIGAEVVVSVSPLDMYSSADIYREKMEEKEKEEKENAAKEAAKAAENAAKEAAKAALERPVKPSFIPEGYWNGKVYGQAKYGYYIFVENKRCDISGEQRDEILKYQKKKDDYRAKIEEIEKGNVPGTEAIL